MPHSSLSTTSHVVLCVRSIHSGSDISSATSVAPASDDDNGGSGGENVQGFDGQKNVAQYTIRAQMGWLSTQTTESTIEGVFNEVIQLPIRWRDLPRDAALDIEVVQSDGLVVSDLLDATISDTMHRMLFLLVVPIVTAAVGPVGAPVGALVSGSFVVCQLLDSTTVYGNYQNKPNQNSILICLISFMLMDRNGRRCWISLINLDD